MVSPQEIETVSRETKPVRERSRTQKLNALKKKRSVVSQLNYTDPKEVSDLVGVLGKMSMRQTNTKTQRDRRYASNYTDPIRGHRPRGVMPRE